MEFSGILFDGQERGEGPDADPDYFTDLNLDQVLAALVAGREEYHLEPFFRAPLHDVATVEYRHHIQQDLDDDAVRQAITGFAERMSEVRRDRKRARTLRDGLQRQRWALAAMQVYCGAVRVLAGDLDDTRLASDGLIAFRKYLLDLVAADDFTALADATAQTADKLAQLNYSLHIKGGRVDVTTYQDEADYSAAVLDTFAKFKQGGVKDYRVAPSADLEVNGVEARVLDIVAKLYPETFDALAGYCDRYAGVLDEAIVAFDREVQFYLAYREFIAPLKRAGLEFCYPRVSTEDKAEQVTGAADLALANKLVAAQGRRAHVVRNGYRLSGQERLIVVTGPNQGGKTTFARMFGQLHHLAALGLPVPGEEVTLFLPGRLFTHFEREEDIETLRGKLADELARMHEILTEATADSVLVMNESFSSTALRDTVYIGERVLTKISERGMLAVCTTFVDELAALNEATVSMVATVDPDDPAHRTFELVRRPADGYAYAAAIAEKYGLSYESVKVRVGA